MTIRVMLLSGALAFASGAVPGPAPARPTRSRRPRPPRSTSRAAGSSTASERRRAEKMREAREKGGGSGGRPPGGGPGGGGMGGPGGGMGGPGGGGGGRMGPPPGMGGDDDSREAMRAIMEPAEELAIAQTGTEIAVDEKFGRTRRLHPDGKKYKTDNGASDIKTSWKEGRLLVETKGSRGGGVVETWRSFRREPPDRERQDAGRVRAGRRAQAHLRPREGRDREVRLAGPRSRSRSWPRLRSRRARARPTPRPSSRRGCGRASRGSPRSCARAGRPSSPAATACATSARGARSTRTRASAWRP